MADSRTKYITVISAKNQQPFRTRNTGAAILGQTNPSACEQIMTIALTQELLAKFDRTVEDAGPALGLQSLDDRDYLAIRERLLADRPRGSDDFPSQHLSLFSVFLGQSTFGAQPVKHPLEQIHISGFEPSAIARERHDKPPSTTLALFYSRRRASKSRISKFVRNRSALPGCFYKWSIPSRV